MKEKPSTVPAPLDRPIPGPRWTHRILAGWAFPGLLGGLLPLLWATTPPDRQRLPLVVALVLGTAVAAFVWRYVRVSRHTTRTHEPTKPIQRPRVHVTGSRP